MKRLIRKLKQKWYRFEWHRNIQELGEAFESGSISYRIYREWKEVYDLHYDNQVRRLYDDQKQ